MRVPLKLSAIDQEHLQELYDQAGVARDELPYSPKFEDIWQGFQDRTFKNAQRDQLFGALLKYVRSSSCAAGDVPPVNIPEDKLKILKTLLPRHAAGGKLLPYSDEFEAARHEFNKLAQLDIGDQEFWRAIVRIQGPKRLPPKRARVAAPPADDDDE